MTFAPFKARKTRRAFLKPLDDDEDGYWSEELKHAALEALVASAPVIVAGAFEVYVMREKNRAKAERERHRCPKCEGDE